MFISTKIVLAVSFLTSSLAGTLNKRAYTPELKAMLAHIDESWKNIEARINAFPKGGATVDDFKAANSAIGSLGDYMEREYTPVIMQNGPFTNAKWSDEFLEDMKKYQANGVNAMRTLKTYVPEVNGDFRCSRLFVLISMLIILPPRIA
ncbi:hypothetical protein EST38_g4061 [Candolleomyces aberdarensis]|uniref:Uncharacterized protein n=1 Tax=Candolleomyces aberdarensis TaxID=2316362 RepID=A0A4Q2DP09_9AGAR|nr:hypothetical protein EST38_g4061 [Candolleomyces aberdarensis]